MSLLVLILCLAALFMGAHAIHLVYRIVFRGLGRIMLEKSTLAAMIATTLLPAFASCCLFLFAVRVLLADRTPIRHKLPLPLAAILLALLYAPFYWIVGSGWVVLSPVFPGFVGGVFTKPMDSKALFAIASGIDTILIIVSLAIICDRAPRGSILATVFALVISASTSYASYCYLHG
jgi:hypothetical protein